MATYNSANGAFQAQNKTLFDGVAKFAGITDELGIQVARGLVPGVQGLSISGFQAAVSSTYIPLWDQGAVAYTYFASAQQVRVWSSSASDTNVSVLINGLDSNYNILTETVVLTNGATGVLTTGLFLRINNITLTRTPMNVGIISAGSSDKTITLAVIPVGTSRSAMTVFTVPNGYTFYLTQVNAYTNQNGSRYSNYRSYTMTSTGLITTILQFPLVSEYNSTKVVPRPYLQRTDIQWQFNSTGTSQIGAQIEGYLIANTV